MIRIDLGKTGEQRARAGKKKSLKNFSVFEKLQIDKSDLGGFLLLLGAIAFAFLPHLFVEQFKEQSQKKHESQKLQMTQEKVALDRQISEYSRYQSELESFEKASALLKERLAAVNDLLASRSGPVNTLDALGQSLPPGAWLNNISLLAESEPSIQFSGAAYSNEDITDLAEKLINSIYFEKVELKEVTGGASGYNSLDAKSFSISAIPKAFKGGKKKSN